MNGGSAELHPLVEGFVDAGTYDRGRPRYGADVVASLLETLGLAVGAAVLELGAGTGQLSEALVAAGLELTAVEPLEQTREMLARRIGAERVRAGVAERIPLAENSVQAVLAADSFHWFDHSRAVPEIRRVLRPGGGVAVLRSLLLFDAPWGHELGTLVASVRPAHPAYDGPGPAAALGEQEGFAPVSEITIRSQQLTDREMLLAYISSISWIGALGESDRRRLLDRAEEVLESHEMVELTLPVSHRIWATRLR